MQRNILYPPWFLIPSLLIFMVLYIIPTFSGFYYAFTDWNIYKLKVEFVGLRQFIDLYESRDLFTAFGHTFIYSIIVTILQNGLGFCLALVLNSALPAKNWFRTIFFLPCVLSALVIGYTFSAIMHPEGILNQFLGIAGLDALRQEWIGNGDIALYSVALVHVWQWCGFSMAIYLAGLQSIPKELVEAAIIDGSGYASRIRHIVFPLIAPAFTINIIMCLIGTLKAFEMVYVMTGGGPGRATEVVNTFIFQQFSEGQYAYGTAANVCLIIVIAVISFTVLRQLRKREVEL